MIRFSTGLFGVVLVLFPLPARGGPEAGEKAVLEASLSALDEAAECLADLADFYLREKRIAEAREVVDAVAEIARMQQRIAARLGAPASPAPVPEPPVAPGAGRTAGGADTVDLGLAWLAAHQDADGSWDGDGFMKHDSERGLPPCDGAGNTLYDVGVTGLALLAFLGAGNTHADGPYAGVLSRGLSWLASVQDPEGCFGPRTSTHFTYCTGIATLAMCEAYGLTSTPRLKEQAQRGVDFILGCRNPYLAWRYGVRPADNDTSVSGWMTMALHSAKLAGMRVDEAAFEGMRAWLDKVTEPEYGRVGYTARGMGPARPMDMMDRFPADRSEALTAVGIHCRMLMGEDPRGSEVVRKGLSLLAKCPPVWNENDGSIDIYYWYFGTLATFLAGGEDWRAWSAALGPVLAHQRTEPDSFRGSFDPLDAWGRDGGRVYSTALMTLCAEVLSRHGRATPGGK